MGKIIQFPIKNIEEVDKDYNDYTKEEINIDFRNYLNDVINEENKYTGEEIQEIERFYSICTKID